jgi:hypothetical protein
MLGMDPTTAFPIMMGSCAFLMPVASTQFIATDPMRCARPWGSPWGACRRSSRPRSSSSRCRWTRSGFSWS